MLNCKATRWRGGGYRFDAATSVPVSWLDWGLDQVKKYYKGKNVRKQIYSGTHMSDMTIVSWMSDPLKFLFCLTPWSKLPSWGWSGCLHSLWCKRLELCTQFLQTPYHSVALKRTANRWGESAERRWFFVACICRERECADKDQGWVQDGEVGISICIYWEGVQLELGSWKTCFFKFCVWSVYIFPRCNFPSPLEHRGHFSVCKIERVIRWGELLHFTQIITAMCGTNYSCLQGCGAQSTQTLRALRILRPLKLIRCSRLLRGTYIMMHTICHSGLYRSFAISSIVAFRRESS